MMTEEDRFIRREFINEFIHMCFHSKTLVSLRACVSFVRTAEARALLEDK